MDNLNLETLDLLCRFNRLINISFSTLGNIMLALITHAVCDTQGSDIHGRTFIRWTSKSVTSKNFSQWRKK